MIIGLTGGTGTGKTSISRYFAKAGFEIIDYDKVTREVYAKGSDCLIEIVSAFGSGILESDGSLNRKALGAIVFADKNALELLNKTVYKYILAYTDETIKNAGDKKLLLDAPTLFEAGLHEKCDSVVGVIADKNLRLERIMLRDGLDLSGAQNRINSQKSDEFYKENCDYIIENNGVLADMEKQVSEILKNIES